MIPDDQALRESGFEYGCGAGGPEWTRSVGQHYLLVTEADGASGYVLGVYAPDGEPIVTLYFHTAADLLEAICKIGVG
ncbi:MAG TPA: hypothetical protein VE967_19425 [Gemmatimonadaceae bacterium]|nr:hypothetical protein [Gemmatimonadaceae bacterium]